MTIGEKIKDLRLTLGRGPTEFAKMIGVSPQVLNSWEKGESCPKHNSLQKIINTTGINPNEFFDGIEIMETKKASVKP